MLEDWQHGGFGLYVHWPFCQAKCPYCDFNSHVVSAIDQDRWREAYVSEIRRLAEETQGRVLRSIFFGGGTPSLMDVNVVADIIRTASDCWSFSNDIEITLEANPTSTEAGRFEGYRAAGVNRVSLGVQALNDTDLKALGRLHSAEEARQAVALAMRYFDRVSFDLIYARQNQYLGEWRDELKRALEWGSEHLSLYQLTIEDGTAFGDRFQKGGLTGLPSESLATDLYFATQEICADAGLPCYETSNHARPGAESRHNLIYWKSGDYLGIGPGAHGRLTLGQDRYETDTPLAPVGWLRAVEEQGSGELQRLRITSEDQFAEFLLMGLRTLDGVDLNRHAFNADINNKINGLCESGHLNIQQGHLSTTEMGRPLLNAILRELLGG